MPPKVKQRIKKPAAEKPLPAPFSPAPPELDGLLSTWDKSVVYITHIDTHPAWFKKRIFAVPVILNFVIALFLLWRAYYILPHYWAILMSVLGNENETTIYWEGTPWSKLMIRVLKRMLSFTIDFLLFRIVGPWPLGFFFETPGNPIYWRWTIGFRDEEVYVRQSRSWGAEDLLGAAQGSSGKAGAESIFFKTRILPAIDATRLREKTGYLLMDGNFDLDFYAMTAATQLLDKKKITAASLRKSVFVYVGDLTSDVENGLWAVWNCAELDEDSETEARNKVLAFKDRLTTMGKESLFFKWVELIQHESSAPGGFTEERQVAAAEKVKKMFQEQGVDFDEFSREIGGMPGM